MSYCTSASRPSISLSVRRSVEPWPSEACGDKGPRETEPWPSTRGPGSAPHRQPGPVTRSRPRACGQWRSARWGCGRHRRGLRPCSPGGGTAGGTQRCGPVSRTGKQGAEVRTCGWTQATTSTDGSQGRGLGDKPWPPPYHLQPQFLHLWGGGLWSSPHRGRVCGRRAQSRTHSLDAKVGAPRPRDRLAQSARPRLGSLGARQLLASEGTWRGTRPDPCDRAATRSKRRAAARAKPVTERCARAELQPPGARRRGRGCRQRPAQL